MGSLRTINFAGKAARDAYLRSVAIEVENVKVLNYAPGPLRTEMGNELKEKGFLKSQFADESFMQCPKRSVDKLLKVVECGNYESGAHLDFFDL